MISIGKAIRSLDSSKAGKYSIYYNIDNPDIDADTTVIFWHDTSEISKADIKTELVSKFNDEYLAEQEDCRNRIRGA
tara:strand:- start:119 stop:349 length:231 start_codon:yes stop_codon:yes gene_type:complete